MRLFYSSLVLILTYWGATATATTCTLDCHHYIERIVATKAGTDDGAAFSAYCRELGGNVLPHSADIVCQTHETSNSSEQGSGSNSLEASNQAIQSCRSQQCGNPTAVGCPSGVVTHYTTPGTPSCTNY